MRVSLASSWLVLAVTVGGCADREMRAAERSAGVVDQAVPIEVSLERFRRGLARTDSLAGGHESREALVRGLVRALERRDTAALRRMVLARNEFAWLYYPSSALARPPYELPPDLLWFQTQGLSEKGASLLLSERAGFPLHYVGHECRSVRTEGGNRIHGHCVLRRVTARGDTIGDRLFGLIMERGGIYKFVSYANKLD